MSGPRWDGLLLDIDGVLHVGSVPVPGARESLAQLRERLPLRLVTNTTSRSRRLVTERLVEMGFELSERDVLTPAALAVAHCRAQGFSSVALHVAPALAEDFAGLEAAAAEAPAPDAVIVGDLGEDFTPARMNLIFGQLQAGAELIALQRNRVWQTSAGLVLDAGPYVVALEYASGRQATVTGKPSPAFFAAALAQLGVGPGRAAMVGDDIEADVGGALDCGIDAVLVRTGKFREESLRASGIEPTLTLDSIADLPGLL